MQKPVLRRLGAVLSWQFVVIAALSAGVLLGTTEARASWSPDPALRKAEKRYNRSTSARERLAAWHDLLQGGHRLTEREQLEAVNHGINRLVRFEDDSAVWQRRDYWATPLETLARGAGDCEDFALAKYFTLLQLGVPRDRLRLVYAKALDLNQAHMVLVWQGASDTEPLVLDNLTDGILPVSQRPDLVLRYAFDTRALYALEDGEVRRIGDSAELPAWRRLLARAEQEGLAR
ncbi:transglutaminase-like cysteine peptidase [Metapseudomonas furukawaii]|uniref:transglutaminase-like cysteine peptidase n=1 Tax=Metapseudomonas furukawaii TaxID=1149133 RepID=UPI00227C2E4A|nr:transglutaminase-like cysteine peptidase [Pseudomonas furukawaii]WAG77848.1 transglutaminase-like cysteine peptidase [Pseudomonas furukawaii]